MKDVLLFWIQWAGKWTQAHALIEAFPWLYSYFSSWDMFRALTWAPNAIGDYVKDIIERGDLISDEVTLALFDAYIQTVIDVEKKMLLDWFPRTIPQMEKMMKLFKEYNREVIGIQFVIPDEVVIERMKERWRKDDTDEGIARRLESYYEQTQPTIDWFEENGTLIKIDANRSVEEIAQDVKNAVSL